MYYLYTETAFHHEGDFDYLLRLIDESAGLGVNGVKFQVLIDTNAFLSRKHSAYEALEKFVFSYDQWKKIFAYTHKKGLDNILMPCDPGALDLCNEQEFSVSYLDLHSVSFYDEELLEKMKQSGVPVILGVGGRTLKEINDKAVYFGKQLAVLMTGFQSFPSELKDVCINRISRYKELYPGMSIGYADHSSFDHGDAVSSNEYAYLLGATFFEKHFTLNEGLKRTDFQSAVGKEKMRAVKAKLDYLDSLFAAKQNDDELFTLNAKEITYRNRQRVAVAAKDLKAGETLSKDLVKFKMIDKEGGLTVLDFPFGKTTKEDILKDDIITLTLLS